MRKLDYFAKYTDELRKLIMKNPNLPIVVIVDPEVCGDDEGWWYAPHIEFGFGEILNCQQVIDDEKVFVDRDDFRDSVEYGMDDDPKYKNLSDEEFDKAVDEKVKEYDPYWIDVIQIRATT